MASWDSIFKREGRFFLRPHEDMENLVRFLKKRGARRILDLGCGSGRHTVFLAKEGFDVCGIDESLAGLAQAREWLKEEGLRARLKRASCYERFPFANRSFDAIVSVQVIHHAIIGKIMFCISEMERTLAPRGTIFVTLPKTRRNEYRPRVKTIAPRTFVPLEGYEIGIPHYNFNKALIRKYFRDFSMVDLHVDGYKHYCLIAMLKTTSP